MGICVKMSSDGRGLVADEWSKREELRGVQEGRWGERGGEGGRRLCKEEGMDWKNALLVGRCFSERSK